jgi:hypothetical protein
MKCTLQLQEMWSGSVPSFEVSYSYVIEFNYNEIGAREGTVVAFRLFSLALICVHRTHDLIQRMLT